MSSISLLSSETDFALRLLRETVVVSEDAASLIISPLSISTAFAMLHSGAKGDTKAEIRDVILKGSTDDEFLVHFSDLVWSLHRGLEEGVEVSIANRIFIRDGEDIKDSYLDHIEEKYRATAQKLNFERAEEAAKEVNNFVSTATHKKITELVTADAFVGGGLVLINALYLDAKWMDVFDSSSTREGNFHTRDGKSKTVDFMVDKRRVAYYCEDAQVQVALLDYRDSEMKFAIFLPKEMFGLTEFVENLSGEEFQNYLSKAKCRTLNMKFPRMQIETSVKLPDILKELGMLTLFSAADLSGIAQGLQIADARHKAVIEVNEKGTVAAAATSVELERERVKVVNFIADHPFLFAVVYRDHPVFVGMFQGE